MDITDGPGLPQTSEGLLIRSDLLARGIPAKSIDAALLSGAWQRLQRAVYVPAGRRLTPRLVASAALHTLNVAGTISHHTAARLHGFTLARDPATEHVTVPYQARRPHRSLLTVHCHDIEPPEITRIEGIPVTTADRTATDMLFHADQLTALWVCEQAIKRGVVDIGRLRRAVEARAGTPHSRRARRLARGIDPLSESPLETAARMVLLAGKLPPPRLQMPITDDAGRIVFRLDLAYPEFLLGIELDGRATHGRPDAVLADRRRQNDLAARGWTILRFTWFDVTRRPDYVVATVRDTLAQLRHAA